MKILAVENNAIHTGSLESIIADLGYELAGIVDNASAALQLIDEASPDLILMNIDATGAVNGIELAARISSSRRLPIIFVTGDNDKETIQRARLGFPKVYIVKPYETASLQSAIELAIFNEPVRNAAVLQPETMGDTFYIKNNNRLVKIRLRDILVVEVDETCCFIVTARNRHLINMQVKDLLEKLPGDDFIQVHRFYVVRKSAIEEVNIGEQTLRAAHKTISIGKAYQEDLFATINYLA